MRPVRAAHRELAFRTPIKNITWACASRSGDALIDAACCTRGWICFCVQGTAEHPRSSSGCYMETSQLTPVDGQDHDAVADAALPGFPSRMACKSCFCNEAKRNNRDTAAPGARGMTVSLQEAEPSESPQAAGQGRLPLLPKPIFRLLFSQASHWRPNTSGQRSAASCGVWWRGGTPAL